MFWYDFPDAFMLLSSPTFWSYPGAPGGPADTGRLLLSGLRLDPYYIERSKVAERLAGCAGGVEGLRSFAAVIADYGWRF